MRELKVADLFCGAGGTTTGAMRAIHEIGREVEFVAVNHWPIAIATHEANHPNVRHYCKDLDTANPNEIVPEGELDLLLASPECRFHSPAQGGRPLDEQNRASAWHVARWAERLYIRRIVVENVPRFIKWGPLDRHGRPIKSREGELFNAWIKTLEAIGYRVEWRVLNAADYGTPQTRKRLFVQARRDGRRIVWPSQTHARRGSEETLSGALDTWEPARSVIDFSKRGVSIFRKRLSPKTLARIEEGVKRYCHGPFIEPFLVMLRRHGSAQSLSDPLATITAAGTHHALVQPYLIPQGGGGVARGVDEPLPTVATDGAIGMVEPFLIPQSSSSPTRSVDDPLPTITTTSRGVGVVEPFLVSYSQRDGGGKKKPHGGHAIDEPLPTLLTREHLAVVEPVAEPFIMPQNRNPRLRGVDEPLPTIVASGRSADLIEPVVEPFTCANRTNNAPRSVDEPLAVITTAHGGGMMLVEPYIVESNHAGKRKARSVEEPLPTVTQKNGFGLCEPMVVEIDGVPHVLDLLHRMLDVDELGRGQDFDGYSFTGTREQQTKQIGNAVPIRLAQAMTRAALHDLGTRATA